jgi:xanthine dehydrogenase accessory factor
MRDVTLALAALLDSGRAGALATVIKTTGSTPQVPGARLLLLADGSSVGTIGGGAIERKVLEALSELLAGGEPRVLACDLARDLGMCCGGSMEVFLEPVRAEPRLTLFGAGHVAAPTAALARSVGFDVVVVDEREALNTSARFPGCRLELADVKSALDALAPGERDYLLIVTHDHRLDEEALRFSLKTRARYIGLVGSRRKVYRLLERVVAREGRVDLTRVYAPVGVDVGAVTPGEIAVSIVAELVALRRGVNVVSHLRTVGDAKLEARLAEVARVEPASDASEQVEGTRGEGAPRVASTDVEGAPRVASGTDVEGGASAAPRREAIGNGLAHGEDAS